MTARLLRNWRLAPDGRLQFSLRSLLLTLTAVGILISLDQFLFRSEPDAIPLAAHIWCLGLLASIIGGMLISGMTMWYFAGGLIGIVVTAPFLIIIYTIDVARIPVVTLWSTMFVFAIFANLGGGILVIPQ